LPQTLTDGQNCSDCSEQRGARKRLIIVEKTDINIGQKKGHENKFPGKNGKVNVYAF